MSSGGEHSASGSEVDGAGSVCSTDDDALTAMLPLGQTTLTAASFCKARAPAPVPDSSSSSSLPVRFATALASAESTNDAAEPLPPSSCPDSSGAVAVTPKLLEMSWDLASSSSSSSSSTSRCSSADSAGVVRAPDLPRSRSRSPCGDSVGGLAQAPLRSGSAVPVASVDVSSLSGLSASAFGMPSGPQVGDCAAAPPEQPQLQFPGMAWWHTPLWHSLLPFRMKSGQPKRDIYLESLCSGTAAELMTAEAGSNVSLLAVSLGCLSV